MIQPQRFAVSMDRAAKLGAEAYVTGPGHRVQSSEPESQLSLTNSVAACSANRSTEHSCNMHLLAYGNEIFTSVITLVTIGSEVFIIGPQAGSTPTSRSV